jgi:hypothetical protein
VLARLRRLDLRDNPFNSDAIDCHIPELQARDDASPEFTLFVYANPPQPDNPNAPSWVVTIGPQVTAGQLFTLNLAGLALDPDAGTSLTYGVWWPGSDIVLG